MRIVNKVGWKLHPLYCHSKGRTTRNFSGEDQYLISFSYGHAAIKIVYCDESFAIRGDASSYLCVL